MPKVCPECGYNLTGLDSTSCPECGASIVGATESTRQQIESQVEGGWLLQLLGGGFWMCAFPGFYAIYTGELDGVPMLAAVLLLALAVAALGQHMVISAKLKKIGERDQNSYWRRWSYVRFLCMLILQALAGAAVVLGLYLLAMLED